MARYGSRQICSGSCDVICQHDGFLTAVSEAETPLRTVCPLKWNGVFVELTGQWTSSQADVEYDESSQCTAYCHRFNFGRSLTDIQTHNLFQNIFQNWTWLLVEDRRVLMAQQFGGSGVGLLRLLSTGCRLPSWMWTRLSSTRRSKSVLAQRLFYPFLMNRFRPAGSARCAMLFHAFLLISRQMPSLSCGFCHF